MRPRFFAPLLAVQCLLAGQVLFAQPAPRPRPGAAAPAAKPAAKPAAGPAGRAPAAPRAAPIPGVNLPRAHAFYQRQSYAQALKLYRLALARNEVPAVERPMVDYRVARCLSFTEQWDAALAETIRVTQRHPGGLWDARARAWLMQLYLKVPHAAWKVGNRYYRGEDAPEVEGEAEPEQLYLEDEDLKKSVQWGEQAKALYEKINRAGGNMGPEEADLSADLARVVSAVQLSDWIEAKRWKAPGDPEWKLDAAAPYDPAAAPPKKVLHLYLSAEATGNDTQKGVARLTQAMWLRAYQARMREAAREDHPEGLGKPIPFPYQGRIALDVLRSVSKDYPAHPEAARSRLIVGYWLNEDEKYPQALQAFQALQKDLPDSKWAPLARVAEQEITRLRLRLTPPPPQQPGARAQIQVDARNLKEVRLTAYRVRLDAMVKDARVLARPNASLQSLIPLLGGRKGVQAFAQIDPAPAEIKQTWTAQLTEKEDYAPVNRMIETPLTKNGAYVIEADGGPVRATVLLLISDLAVIQVVEHDRAHAFVVNAQTGAPVVEASALIREVYQAPGEKEPKPAVSAATATTDADGLAEKPLAPKRLSTQHVNTLAWKGDRYALTFGDWMGGIPVRGPGAATGERRAYVYTERPVYRPAQTVHYRALLTTRKENGDWQPAAGEKVTVAAYDPRNAQIALQEVVVNDFGSVGGKLELPSEAPLGVYRVGVWTVRDNQIQAFGQGQFRVEEYKKPEFEVAVQGPEKPARVGDRLQARITARYYFGAPVPGAKVSYRVVRREWFPATPFPRPYAALYHAPQPEIAPWWDPNWVEIPDEYSDGEAVTGANGEAVIQLDARLADPRFQGRHLAFAIHAEVTDASRRTIEADGEVRALASDFDAFLSLRRGFWAVGDRLQADVRTLDAAGRPIAAAGTVRVIRLTAREGQPGRPAGYDGREVHAEPLRTDAAGRGVFAWPAPEAGAYEIRFEARDSREALVTARERVWVAGEGAGAGVFRNEHVQVIPDQSTYRLGEKARLLVVADEPGLSILLTQEAGNRILEKRVIRLQGRHQVVELALKREHSPDLVIRATGIRDRGLFQAEARLYVPPAEQLLTMEVTADKAVYRPGEKARFRVRARDVDGRPVRTEASLGIVDASVFYIQGDMSGAIGPHFYAGERGSDVRPAGSTATVFAGQTEDDQPPLKRPEVPWEAPRGLGHLPEDALFDPIAAGGERQTLSAGGLGGGLGAAPGAAPMVRSPEAAMAPVPSVAREKDRGGGAGAEVRSNFADTAFWTPAVVTDAQGEAVVEMTWPDNLTQWRATARGWTPTVQVGEAFTDVTTSKDLLVRLQAPRFFMERDEVVLSANVHNYTEAAQRVRVRLHLEGDTLYSAAAAPLGPPRPRPVTVPRPDRPTPPPSAAPPPVEPADESFDQWVDLPKGGEKRLDWRVRVERPGEAVVRVTAEAGGESDGVQLKFPVLTHGVEKLIVKNGALLMAPGEKPGDKSAQVTLNLPVERATDSGALVVQVSPSLAATMLDALPYLVDYPYGCVEQTMSRFLPAVLCAKTLTDLGVDLETLRKRAEAEHRRILAETAGDRPVASGYTYPEGAPGLRDLRRMQAEQWAWRAQKSPVYQPELLKKMVAEGLARLRRFQNADGGWGWWKDDRSDPLMSAYVVQGLVTGKAAGMEPPGEMLTRGLKYLDGALRRAVSPHDVALLGSVVTLDPARAKAAGPLLLERAFARRDRLTAYSLALLALALGRAGQAEAAGVCLENLENTARVDPAAGTCSWPRVGGRSWDWQNDPVETAAACLRAFNRLAPKHRLAPMIVRWLVNRRGGDAWDSTRTTALAVQALAEHVRAARELAPDYDLTIEVGGFKQTVSVDADNALLFENRFVVPAPALGSGPQTLTILRQGQGNVYYSAYLRYFTLEEDIQPAGNEIRVRRRYFRLTRPEGTPPKDAPLSADGYLRSLLRPGQKLTSGDLVEVELLLESKNDYSHLVIEDMKPAGCEPVDLRSGERYGGGLCSNMELRDEKVAFFITRLPQGKRLLSYRVRAEVPGAFHALPTNGYAMYAPEVRCLGEEAVLGIEDGPARLALRRRNPR
jgi:uncharacterized protein YfaS (alpha-2-macroglobulin family)